MLIKYINTALRSIFRFKSNSAINLIGLSCSFATALVISVYIMHEFQIDKFNKNIDKIFRIELGSEENRHAYMPEIVARKIAEDLPEVEKFVRFGISEGDDFLKYNEKILVINDFLFADSCVFDVFTFPFVQGSPSTALQQPFSLVLTESTANKIFGSENPINKTVKYNNYFNFTVTGVIKDIKDFHISINALASFGSLAVMNGGGNLGYNNWSYPSYLMLRQANYDIKSIEKKINEDFSKTDYWKDKEPKFKLNNLANVYFSRQVIANHAKAGNLQFIFILISICILTLFLACINFINLETSKSIVKQKEIGIKKILGITKFQLSAQFYIEIFIVSSISMLISFLLLRISQPYLIELIGTDFSFQQLYSLKGFLAILLILLSTTLFIGAFPVSRGSFFFFTNSNKSVIPGKGSMPRKSLIVFQFLLSIVLVMTTTFTYKQMNFMKKSDLGFEKEHVVIVRISSDIKNNASKQQILKDKLLSNPNIIAVSYACLEPGIGWWTASAEIDGEKKDVNVNSIDFEFLNALKIGLVSGRNFSPEIESDKRKTFILNESAVKFLNINSPVGKTIKSDIGEGTVIGVTKDFHFNSMHTPIQPLVFYNDDRMYNKLIIKCLPQNIPAALDHIQEVWKEISPEIPIEYSFLDKTFDSNYHADDDFNKLLGAFALLAILIACLGIFGIASFLASQRTKEIGIRKVSGATVSEVMVMLNRDFVKWVAIAFLIAVPIAYYVMNKWLENFAYKTSLSWWIFALAGLLALGIALLTVSWQSWKAATRNPVEALRYE